MEYKTLEELINRDNKYDLSKITYLTSTTDDGLIIPDTNVFQIYMRYIRNYITVFSVTPEMRKMYAYRPYHLSTAIYGSPDLGWLIMRLNDQESPSKFKLKSTVKIIPPDYLSEIYDYIVAKASDKLSINWSQFTED